jgi:hypothetical protein
LFWFFFCKQFVKKIGSSIVRAAGLLERRQTAPDQLVIQIVGHILLPSADPIRPRASSFHGNTTTTIREIFWSLYLYDYPGIPSDYGKLNYFSERGKP